MPGKADSACHPDNSFRFTGFIWIALSCLATPLVLFVCTTNSLYLKNQIDLACQIQVLYPFLLLFIITSAGGFVLALSHKRHGGNCQRFFLCGYLLAGPFFIAYGVLHSTFPAVMDMVSVFFCFNVLYLFSVKLLSLKGNVFLIQKFFAVIFVALVSTELLLFLKQVEFHPPGIDRVEASRATNSDRENKPNIYHIIFDEYQTDMFQLTLTSEIKKRLAGFLYFPQNTSLYGRTRMSLASTFLGQPYNYTDSQIDYQASAYNSPKSFLYWLIKAGYKTSAFLHPLYMYDQKLFHFRTYHKTYAGISSKQDNRLLFRNIWMYAYSPKFISKHFMQSEDMDQLENQNLLPDEAPILSYACFKKFLQAEESLPGSNRYVFMHLILPHFPNVLCADCTWGAPEKGRGLPRTSVLEQSQCATRLILDLIGRLKQLNRFENSMIVIHGDHGSRYKVEGNDLVKVKQGFYSAEWSKARSRALLLIKLPVEKNFFNEFTTLYSETTLIDIAPTILDAVDIATDISFAGRSLANPGQREFRKKRYYHFYDKKGRGGWTDEMTRFIIENNTISKEKVISLHDPKPKKRALLDFPWLR